MTNSLFMKDKMGDRKRLLHILDAFPISAMHKLTLAK